MSYPRLIEWEDLGLAAQRHATRVLVKMTGIHSSYAEDFVSEAVLRLMRRPTMVTNNPRSLLIQTALNLFLAARSRKHGSPFLPSQSASANDAEVKEAEEPTDSRPTPANELCEDEAKAEANSRLNRALSRLAADDRDRVHAYYFENRNLADMDREQGDAEGTAKTHVHRVRERLRRAWLEAAPKPGRG